MVANASFFFKLLIFKIKDFKVGGDMRGSL